MSRINNFSYFIYYIVLKWPLLFHLQLGSLISKMTVLSSNFQTALLEGEERRKEREWVETEAALARALQLISVLYIGHLLKSSFGKKKKFFNSLKITELADFQNLC